jgi:Ser/Thr protein kinase RdoA (MazF antagonist)
MLDAIRVQDSTASASAVAELIHRRYPLPVFPACTFWRKGMGDTYRLEAGSRLYFLKIPKAVRRTRPDIEEEVRLLLHLVNGGVAVAVPVQTYDGAYFVTLSMPEGERYAVLYEGARGVEGSSDLHRRELGRMLARMHLCADTLDPVYNRADFELKYVLDDSLAVIEPLMAHRRADYEVIARIATHAKDMVTSLLPQRYPEHGVCHGDLHGGDVLYSPDGQPVIFDFDSSGTGWRALDIAIFQGASDWMDMSQEADLRRQHEVGQFLEGYTSVRTMSSGEAEVLKLDQAVHHIFLMGLVLRFWHIHDGLHWANDGFLDWHMKWFRHWIEQHRI